MIDLVVAVLREFAPRSETIRVNLGDGKITIVTENNTVVINDESKRVPRTHQKPNHKPRTSSNRPFLTFRHNPRTQPENNTPVSFTPVSNPSKVPSFSSLVGNLVRGLSETLNNQSQSATFPQSQSTPLDSFYRNRQPSQTSPQQPTPSYTFSQQPTPSYTFAQQPTPSRSFAQQPTPTPSRSFSQQPTPSRSFSQQPTPSRSFSFSQQPGPSPLGLSVDFRCRRNDSQRSFGELQEQKGTMPYSPDELQTSHRPSNDFQESPISSPYPFDEFQRSSTPLPTTSPRSLEDHTSEEVHSQFCISRWQRPWQCP